ncbi:hypothetical protein [Lacipirellula parvula]|uniref:Uncharacterized protein n=1 Tax=Lacipirellula parvula TaxID=2650471 RepID=A0A5K7X4S6_9BACT|nr:hypothetical protein [Lacipirellula parvula]BBO30777.1 hypothetical protein PLANPX_0389 [Lacipirellula parvula]
MLTYLRYGLATICFALSVACWGLRWWASIKGDFYWSYSLAYEKVVLLSANGMVALGKIPHFSRRSGIDLYFFNVHEEARFEKLGYPEGGDEKVGWFGVVGPFYYFPLWYPSLVFALRRHRRPSLRPSFHAPLGDHCHGDCRVAVGDDGDVMMQKRCRVEIF